jgi:hypothetical protein
MMEIKKNIVRKHLDAISATRRDIYRLIALSFKIKGRTFITTSNKRIME